MIALKIHAIDAVFGPDYDTPPVEGKASLLAKPSGNTEDQASAPCRERPKD